MTDEIELGVTHRLQLIDALEANRAARQRRSAWAGWLSVLAAGAVLAIMIALASRELGSIEKQAATARDELVTAESALEATKIELEAKRTELADVSAQLGEREREAAAARETLLRATAAYLDGSTSLDRVVDDVLEANQILSPTDEPDRSAIIRRLFDPSGEIRVSAYAALLPRYRNDPSLIADVIKIAQEDPQNADGIYNSLVVLSHMNAATLRPYRKEIEAFANAARRGAGPKVTARANTLVNRLQ